MSFQVHFDTKVSHCRDRFLKKNSGTPKSSAEGARIEVPKAPRGWSVGRGDFGS